MPPNQRRSTGASQDRLHDLLRRRLRRREAEHGPRLRAQCDLLRRPRVDTAARRDQGMVVVLPARARQVEQALAFLEARRGVRIGIDEDVAVIEGGDQLDGSLAQHAVAEHVARHVADADHGERLRRDVDIHLAEMALHRYPGAPRGDPHLLVVIAGRAAGGEGIVEPEVVVARDFVGDIGEGRGALVGGDHEIRVVAIVPHHVDRRDHVHRCRDCR